jgi:hypothetical protein
MTGVAGARSTRPIRVAIPKPGDPLWRCVQVVGYDTGFGGDTAPALFIARDGVIERESLSSGRTLAYALGERRCAGAMDGSEHIPCERRTAPHCPAHDSTWICARCTGTCLKAEMDCYQEHAIYLAAFAPATFKVGVTKRSDPSIRLREQGADRGAIVRRVENGRIAREIEAEIAQTTPVPDSVRVETKIDGIGRTVDLASWERLLEEFEVESRAVFEYGLELDSAPISETLAAGTVRGTKGRVLVLERDGGVFGVDMRSLVGYELRSGVASRNLQSSLDSFG